MQNWNFKINFSTTPLLQMSFLKGLGFFSPLLSSCFFPQGFLFIFSILSSSLLTSQSSSRLCIARILQYILPFFSTAGFFWGLGSWVPSCSLAHFVSFTLRSRHDNSSLEIMQGQKRFKDSTTHHRSLTRQLHKECVAIRVRGSLVFF